MTLTFPLALAVVLAGSACSSTTPVTEADPAVPDDPPEPDSTPGDDTAPGYRLLVGELLSEGVERCLHDGTREWVNPHHVIGFTTVVPADGLALDALDEQLVVATGAVDPKGVRFPPVVYEAECPIAQMRSDWVMGKSGIRMERPGMGQVGPAFVASEVRAWDGLAIVREGDALRVTLTNTFDHALRDVVVTVHYEGCYGKPGTATRSATIAVLAPGERLTRDFDANVERDDRPPGRTMYRAFSVQVQAASPRVAFDLDRRLSRAGVFVDCPEERGD